MRLQEGDIVTEAKLNQLGLNFIQFNQDDDSMVYGNINERYILGSIDMNGTFYRVNEAFERRENPGNWEKIEYIE